MTDTPTPDPTPQAASVVVPPSPEDAAHLLYRVQSEVRRVIVGQDRPIERLIVCLLAKGHCLLEGVPGLAKTLLAETLSRTVGGSFARIQFTPDLLPADVMGTRIFRASKEEFDIELGPVFVNFLLADEINRAPAKVQSALLEVMAERQVSIGGKTFPVPAPFLVLATQNPIESEGVYPLPEAQRDRFLMKVTVDYPTAGEEVDIVYRMGVEPPVAEPVISLQELIGLQKGTDAVKVDRSVVDYAVTLVLATRFPRNYALSDIEPLVTFGGSPRASLGLIRAGRCLALLRGRDHLVPQDVFDVAPDVLRHRLVLSYEALAQGVTADQVLARVLSTVPAPRLTPVPAAAPSGYGTSLVAGVAPSAGPAYAGGARGGPFAASGPSGPQQGFGGPAGAPAAAGPFGPGTAAPPPAAPAETGYGGYPGATPGTFGTPGTHSTPTPTGPTPVGGFGQPGSEPPPDTSPWAPAHDPERQADESQPDGTWPPSSDERTA